MIKISTLFTLFVVSFWAVAQENMSLDDYFKGIDINKLKYTKKENVFDNQLKYEKFVQESIWSETPYRAVIKKNSSILDILSGQYITINEPHFANAIRKKDDDQYIYFLDKQNGIRFRTDAMNAKSIEADLDLDARPKIFKSYSGPTEFNKSDSELNLHVMVNYIYEQTSNDYLAQQFSVSGKGEIIGGTFQITLPNSYFLEPGLSFRADTFRLTDLALSNSQILVGPMARFILSSNQDIKTAIDLIFERSFLKKIESENYLSNSMTLRFNLIFPGQVFSTNVGISGRREWIYADGETSIQANHRAAWSFGINLGIGVNL